MALGAWALISCADAEAQSGHCGACDISEPRGLPPGLALLASARDFWASAGAGPAAAGSHLEKEKREKRREKLPSPSIKLPTCSRPGALATSGPVKALPALGPLGYCPGKVSAQGAKCDRHVLPGHVRDCSQYQANELHQKLKWKSRKHGPKAKMAWHKAGRNLLRKKASS